MNSQTHQERSYLLWIPKVRKTWFLRPLWWRKTTAPQNQSTLNLGLYISPGRAQYKRSVGTTGHCNNCLLLYRQNNTQGVSQTVKQTCPFSEKGQPLRPPTAEHWAVTWITDKPMCTGLWGLQLRFDAAVRQRQMGQVLQVSRKKSRENCLKCPLYVTIFWKSKLVPIW